MYVYIYKHTHYIYIYAYICQWGFFRLSQNAILECAVFIYSKYTKVTPYENVISENDKCSMVFGPAFLALLSRKLETSKVGREENSCRQNQ